MRAATKEAGPIPVEFAFVDFGKLGPKPTSGSGVRQSGAELASVGAARSDPAASLSRAWFALYIQEAAGNFARGLEASRRRPNPRQSRLTLY